MNTTALLPGGVGIFPGPRFRGNLFMNFVSALANMTEDARKEPPLTFSG